MIKEDLTQEANALKEVFAKLKEENINKPLFIVRVEDPTIKEKEYYVIPVGKMEEAGNYITVVGFKTSKKQQSNLTTISQALEYLETSNEKVMEVKIPWYRILDIENRSYKRKTK
jgi:hypothetical protein